jgi:uncharacterized membrane protein YbhN (UPF0104 family)
MRATDVLRHPRLITAVKLVVGVLVAVSVARAVAGYRHALVGRLAGIRLEWLAAAALLGAVYRVVNAYGWVLVLRSLGQPMRAVAGVRLWLVSETMRWLPGSVWSLFSRVAQATAAGVPAATASLSMPLELLLTIAAWGVTALVGVGLSGRVSAWAAHLPASWPIWTAATLLVTAAGVALLSRWQVEAPGGPPRPGKVARLLRALGDLRVARPPLASLARTAVFFTVLCFFNGLAFLAVLRATCASPPGVFATVGINAVGWLVGFFAFFAPAGLGVRETGMAAMLAAIVPLDVAVVGVILWRVVQIVVEVICLAACFVPAMASAVRRFATGDQVQA